MDLYGDPLPPGAVARLGTVRLRHGAPISGVAFVCGGSVLASAAFAVDPGVRLWDAASGRLLATLDGPKPEVKALAASADGRLLAAAAGDGRVHLWEIVTVPAPAVPAPSAGPPSASPAFTIRVVRTVLLAGHRGGALAAAFFPDGSRLLTGGVDGAILAWDAATGVSVPVEHPGELGWIQSLAVSPDGRQAATGTGHAQKLIRIWEIAEDARGAENAETAPRRRGLRLKLLRELRGHDNGVRSLAFTRDGRLLISGSSDRTVRVWDVATGTSPGVLEEAGGWVLAVAASPDGRTLATAPWDPGKTITIWDLSPGGSPHVRAKLEGHEGGIHSLAFSPDGKVLASGSGDKILRLWDPAAGRPLAQPEGHGGVVRSLAVLPGGRTLASAGADRWIRFWDPATGREFGRRDGGSGGLLRAIDVSADGRTLAAAGLDRAIRVWTFPTPLSAESVSASSAGPFSAPSALLEGHEGGVNCIALSPDGKFLASGSLDRTVRLWNIAEIAGGAGIAEPTATGRERFRAEDPEGPVYGVAFSPDGSLLAAVSGAGHLTVRIWHRAGNGGGAESAEKGAGGGTFREVARIPGRTGPHVAFSPDGKRLAAGGPGYSVVLWDIARDPAGGISLKEGIVVNRHDSQVLSASFSPDGTRVASCARDGTVRVGDAADGKELCKFAAPGTVPWTVRYLPDGRSVAAGLSDTTVLLWDAAGGK